MQDRIRKTLETLEPRPLGFPFKGSASVLMPLILDQGEPLFLLTKRSHKVGTHKGQVSFPGGMQNQGEAPQTTALRETEEELGIPSREIELVGRFYDYVAVTGWKVMTFVGFLGSEVPLDPNPEEVAQVIRAPLEFFARTQPRVVKRFRLGRKVPIYFYDFGDEVVWGLTAAIIHDFVKSLDL